ncbi:MAG TPA: DNA polymerase I [Thermoleophilaceae bacterium]|nr:DNA polymerase I [Thermoleophilaceae bacterium]
MADDDPRELFLIDGNSLVYRAFFALPETIATSRGFPTNAIFGFASMLVKLMTEYGQKPTIVAWDAGDSGRKEAYAEYKAGRESRPDLLREQWPHMEPLVDAFGYTSVRVDGYEADDVIATLAERAREHGLDVTIVTGDRDAFQLVGDGVKVMATGRGITDTKIYDREAVIDRYGIPPESIPDFYGLKGDTSDNIPGVPGIGDKTAAQLLQQFGDLETVLSSVDDISGAKRKENLVNHADDARVSKQLATSIRNVPVEVDLDGSLEREPDRSRLRDTFREFELRDPLRRLEEVFGEGDATAPRPPPSDETEARARKVEPAGLKDLDGDHATLVAERPVTEEDQLPGLEEQQPLRFAAYAGGEVLTGEAPGGFGELLDGWGDRPVTAHDWKSLAASEDPSEAPPLEHDTMVAAYLIDPARRGYPLEELAEETGLGAKVRDGDHLAERAVIARELAARQRALLEELDLVRLLEEVELPLVDLLVEMERAGVKLDVDQVRTIAKRVGEEAAELERRIWELAGGEFTIGSPQQLAAVLFDNLGLSKKRRGKTGFSTDARVLQAIRSEHEIIPLIEEWRELTKLKSTYLDAFPSLLGDDGRLRTTFNQTAAATGRLSSQNPNLQNIPIRTERGREIRACFVAEDGCRLISADYSQVELRLLAHIAGEDVLKEIFRRGEDVHTATAEQILGGRPGKDSAGMPNASHPDSGTRSKAKMVNYGIVYGLSAYGLADRLQIPQEEAQEFIDRYLERFPAVKQFIEDTIAKATNEGFVATEFGRIRRIPELRARQRQTRMLGERLAVNMVIQGTAADIIKVAMVRCRAALRDSGLETRMVLQIHDELLFEGPEAEVAEASGIVEREMAGAFEMDPPLEVDVAAASNWLEAK